MNNRWKELNEEAEKYALSKVQIGEQQHMNTHKMVFEAVANDIAYHMLSDAFAKGMK